MAELTIQFNYVQDCVVLLREDFLKYTCVILPKEITRGHADNLIKRCRHTVLEDESRLLFGKNAAMADDYYQALHYAQKSGLYDSIKQALIQNFEWMSISAGTRMGIGYMLVGVMRDLTLHGVYPYAIALEVSDGLNNADRLELTKQVVKVINNELSGFEVRTGATALLSEVCEY